MMYVMMPIPPIHATATFSTALFWGMIGLLVALFLLATILWVVGSRRIARSRSQVKEAGWQDEAPPQPQSDEQSQVHAPERELVLRR